MKHLNSCENPWASAYQMIYEFRKVESFLSGGRGSTETLNKHRMPYIELFDYIFSLNLFSLRP